VSDTGDAISGPDHRGTADRRGTADNRGTAEHRGAADQNGTTVIATVLGGALRNVGGTAKAAVTDLVAGGAHVGELVSDRLADRQPRDAVLRVAVLILSDPSGPLCTEKQVRPALDRADAILREQAGIRVRTVAVQVITDPAPAETLDPRANQRLLLDDIRGNTGFFRRHLPAAGTIGAPVTVVVVRDIDGRTTGCSLGMTADWVVCQRSLFDAGNPAGYDETVLAHELGHALNLPHHSDRQNLMFPSSSPPECLRGTALRPWQRLVLNANRHTVPGVRTGPPWQRQGL